MINPPKKWRTGMKQCKDCGRVYPSKTYVKCPDCLSLKYEDYRGSKESMNREMKQCKDCGRVYPSKTYVKCPDCLSLEYEDYHGSEKT